MLDLPNAVAAPTRVTIGHCRRREHKRKRTGYLPSRRIAARAGNRGPEIVSNELIPNNIEQHLFIWKDRVVDHRETKEKERKGIEKRGKIREKKKTTRRIHVEIKDHFQRRGLKWNHFGTNEKFALNIRRGEKSVGRSRLEIPTICILSVTTVARLFLSQQL